MKTKFIGKPNLLVKERKRKRFTTEFIYKPLFRFDENGEYITEDERLIEKLKRKFEYKEINDNPEFLCKKCGASFESRGALLLHYRKDHPKRRNTQRRREL